MPAYSYQSFDLLFSKSEETGGRKTGRLEIVEEEIKRKEGEAA